VCEVNANPGVVDFQWMLDNSTYTEKIASKGLTSSITLIASPEYFGKYKCFANNSIGMSAPCERVISGKRELHFIRPFFRFYLNLRFYFITDDVLFNYLLLCVCECEMCNSVRVTVLIYIHSVQ